MRSVGFLWVLALLMVHGTLFAGFQFSHQTSTMSIRSAKLIVGTPLTDWDGTLQQSGTITGQPITFADGIFTNNTTPAFFNGVYNGSLNPITLDVNRKLVVNCGSFTPQITVIRGGNVLQGQPLFLNRDSINLTHQLSNLTIGVQAALNSNIVLNQGKVTLSDHLFMGDDRTITGSGTMALDRRRFAFGGKDLHLTHTILWSDANDVVLNSRIQLSGIWTFTGVTARLNGNGNVLDLSVGGTILIKSGTTLHVSDIKIRGLGIGQIIFEDKNSSLHITSAELEVVSNLTFTVGGIYAESCSRIITGNKILTFSEQATLSVDQITLYYDTLTFNDTNNIQPLIGAANNPGGKNVASVNNGTIGHLDSGLSTKVRTNSNALLRLTTNNSQALLSCCKNSSNSIINLNSLIRVNSNASLALNKNSSHTLLRLTRNNSQAILNLDNQIRVSSNALLALNKNSSNAILNLNNNIQTANTNIRVNSNAFVSLTTNNSNALLKLFANNSNAILSNEACCRVNSNALLTLATNNSNTLLRLTTNNSQALLYLAKNNSNTILNGDLNQLR
ncbi:hypothetical protein JST56_02145, partial [Candidatus Dependentiae bacterium]|nr:hypothetical protein [Candidatus Dependentiae bacterium]